ncbi:MAG: helix-turn-helix domain-containing protein [Candidatus Pacearchaeota archaeon]|nr:helix-turn-helix domain-containing protein [Candidatus Pacearchaeota archaeon]
MRNINYIELNQDFGDRIKKLLFEKKLTQSKFAELVGVNKGTMSQYINGNVKRIGEDIYSKIIKVLDVHKEYFTKENLNIIKPDEKVKLEEYKVDYSIPVESAPINFNLFLLLAKVVNENFKEEEFKNIFGKTIEQFFEDVGKLCIDARVLQELKYRGVDINQIFEYKTVRESYEIFSNRNNK